MSSPLPPLHVRRADADELDATLTAVTHAFGEEVTPASLESWGRILESDRTFSVLDGGSVVGGASIISFGLSVPGGLDVPTGGLTGVGVLPSHRRRGALRGLIGAVLADGIARGEPLSVLWASEGPIYARYGYGLAALRATIVVSRAHLRFTPPVPEVGRLRMLSVSEASAALPPVWSELARGTPGVFSRTPGWWQHEVLDDAEWRRGGAGPRFIPAIEVDGVVRGYAFYRIRTDWDHLGQRNIVEVRELVAPDPAVELALWRFLAELDLVGTIRAQNMPADTPLFHRVDDPRRLGLTLGDGLWLRILDLPAALAARAWAADDELVLEVTDALVPGNAGRWQLTVRDGRGQATPTRAAPDVTLGIAELGALYLGGIRAAALARAGRILAPDPSTIARLDALHAVGRQPWCPAFF